MSRVSFPELYALKKQFIVPGQWCIEDPQKSSSNAFKEIELDIHQTIVFSLKNQDNTLFSIQVSVPNISLPFTIHVKLSISSHKPQVPNLHCNNIFRFSPLFTSHTIQFPLINKYITQYLSENKILTIDYEIDNQNIEMDWKQDFDKLLTPFRTLDQTRPKTQEITYNPPTPSNVSTPTKSKKMQKPDHYFSYEEIPGTLDRKEFGGTSDKSLLSAFIVLCYKTDAIQNIILQNDFTIFLGVRSKYTLNVSATQSLQSRISPQKSQTIKKILEKSMI